MCAAGRLKATLKRGKNINYNKDGGRRGARKINHGEMRAKYSRSKTFINCASGKISEIELLMVVVKNG